MVLFLVMTRGSMSVAVVMSTAMSVRIVTVTMRIVTMTMTVVRRCDGHLEIMPGHVGEHTVLDVPSEVALL